MPISPQSDAVQVGPNVSSKADTREDFSAIFYDKGDWKRYGSWAIYSCCDYPEPSSSYGKFATSFMDDPQPLVTAAAPRMNSSPARLKAASDDGSPGRPAE